MAALFRLVFAFGASLIVAACSDGADLTTNALLGDTVAVTGNLRETADASLSFERPSIEFVLLLANQGTKPETLTVSSRGVCEGGMIVRAWRNANGKTTLAWVSSAMPFVPCPAHASPVVIAAQSAIPFTREIRNAAILGDSLPAGSYTFTVSADLDSPPLPAQVATEAVFVGPHFVVPAGTVLDGTWSGQADGIQLKLALHWTADSVSGTGTYLVIPPNTNRCGGGTLTGSGNVTVAAARADDRAIGHMDFDNGWGPPYNAVLTSVAFLDGHFMSIDVGPCPIPLSHEGS